MSKLTESFRTVRVFNRHNFYEQKGVVYVYYQASDGGRGVMPSRAKVARQGFKTDPDGPWYDYGDKSFIGTSGGAARRKESMQLAMDWASERYGITEWARDPFGSYGPAEYVKARVAELKQQVKAAALNTDREGRTDESGEA